MDTILQWMDALTFWHWMVLGVLLIVIELVAPGIWFLWLGIGALATGIIVLIIADVSWQIQAVIFSGFSVVSVVIGRMIMRRTKQSEDHPMLNRRADRYVGQIFVLEKDTQLGRGDVRIGDSLWRIQLPSGAAELTAGSKVTVTGVDGATLLAVAASD